MKLARKSVIKSKEFENNLEDRKSGAFLSVKLWNLVLAGENNFLEFIKNATI